MANGRTAAGTLLKYALGALGTVPSGTGVSYTELPECKVIPQVGSEPDVAETTPLSATKNHTYTELLDTLGGGLFTVTANDCAAFRNAWNGMLDDYEDSTTDNKCVWLQIYVPDNKYTLVGESTDTQNSYFLPVKPLPLGAGEKAVDTVMEVNGNFVVLGDFVEQASV